MTFHVSKILKENQTTLVFIHGFLESHVIWDKYTSIIDKSFRTVFKNIPGHDKKPNNIDEYSLRDLAVITNKKLDNKGIEEVTLIGHSMGGYVSLAFAELFPEKVNGMILMNSSALPDSELKKKERQKLIELVKNNRTGFIQNTIPKLFPSYNHKKFKTEIDEIRKMASEVSSEGIIYALEAMINRPDRTHVLKNAKFPVQFIIGKEDPIINYVKIMEQTLLPKDAHVLKLENTGHMAFIEAKEKTFKEMTDFIKYCNT